MKWPLIKNGANLGLKSDVIPTSVNLLFTSENLMLTSVNLMLTIVQFICENLICYEKSFLGTYLEGFAVAFKLVKIE